MATAKTRSNFYTSEDGLIAIAELRTIAKSADYHTSSSYSANAELYPDHKMPFVDKHMQYLQNHPELNMHQYIANIKLMTKVKS